MDAADQQALDRAVVKAGYDAEDYPDTDVHGYEYISISWAGSSPSGKTQKYSVTNNKSLVEIGTISWYGSWRQYVWVPHDGTLYSAGCLEDIADFLVSLRKERSHADQ